VIMNRPGSQQEGHVRRRNSASVWCRQMNSSDRIAIIWSSGVSNTLQCNRF
jgi:hypothetical protein